MTACSALELKNERSVFIPSYKSKSNDKSQAWTLFSIQAQMNEQQDKTSRQVKILMDDIDEERKLRANMQIELDRVKKLVAIK